MRWFLSLFFCIAAAGPLLALDHQVVWGMAYEDNLYEAVSRGQDGWVSRLFFSSAGYPVRGERGVFGLSHQTGLKRFWTPAPGFGESGDVLITQIDARGQVRIGKRWVARGGAHVKFKQATRAPGEESYLRAGVMGRASRRFGAAFLSSFTVRLGADDSRDPLLPEVDYGELGWEVRYGPARRVSATLRLAMRRVFYDRSALVRHDGQIDLLNEDQDDRLHSMGLDLQAFMGALVQLSYVYFWNQSNSFGYAYRAHRIRGMVVRPIGLGVDAQVFVQFQFRKYRDAIAPALERPTEVDEYEQNIAVLKCTRGLGASLDASAQYGLYRNGAQQGDDAYRKHVFTFSLETRF